ncbi:MAG TPA: cysteine peptidase family C39 domain-containing protein, partial [Chroococcales cyanobacterium]
GKKLSGENKALAAALISFKSKNDVEDLSALDRFLSEFPNSRWAPSLLNNVAYLRFKSGYLSEALADWKRSWQLSKNEKGVHQKEVADRAFGEVVLMDARLGRKAELKDLLSSVSKRKFTGSTEEMVRAAKDGLDCMAVAPKRSYRCGPFALNAILQHKKSGHGCEAVIRKSASTDAGTNLAQVKDLSDQVGLHYQMAKREKGAPFVVPSVIHWKLDHFAAILAEKNGRYELRDATFGPDSHMWLTAQALDSETDGYCLVPDEKLPQGFESIGKAEGQKVWGKGDAHRRYRDFHGYAVGGAGNNGGPRGGGGGGTCMANPNCKACQARCGGGKGMAAASAWTMAATLSIADDPLSYSPSVGANMDLALRYNYLEANEPSVFSFSNFGHDWVFGWLSYMTVDATSGIATLRLRDGYGSENYTPDPITGLFPPEFLTHAQLVNIGTNSYERHMGDGAVEVFDLADTSTPPRIFMTEYIDPQGNSVSINYDGDFRITSITDSINQVTTISYGSNTFGNDGFYTITQITDPYGRSCSFAYDGTFSNLLSITDVLGL